MVEEALLSLILIGTSKLCFQFAKLECGQIVKFVAPQHYNLFGHNLIFCCHLFNLSIQSFPAKNHIKFSNTKEWRKFSPIYSLLFIKTFNKEFSFKLSIVCNQNIVNDIYFGVNIGYFITINSMQSSERSILLSQRSFIRNSLKFKSDKQLGKKAFVS